MKSPESSVVRPPSTWWLVVGGVCAALTATAAIAAIGLQRSASEPIGEGEVFVADAHAANAIIASSEDLDFGVRRARNALDVEAVSVADEDGVVIATTAESLAGKPVANALLSFGISSGRFAALATSIDVPIAIDGVEEWPAGSILYQVVSPAEGGIGSILTHYDVSELLARRARPSGLQPEALQLLALAGIFAILAGAVLVGHARATRRYRDIATESEMLRAHSAELSAANEELSKARHDAERALALAEEKIRIRSEFVLMINHELRTPLTGVVTGARIIQEQGVDGPDTEPVLDAIISDGQRLQQIIDQILVVARIENRGLSYVLTDTPLSELVKALESSNAADVEVNVDNVAEEPVIRTDAPAVSLITASLADNARTHGASAVVISCSARPSVDPLIEVGNRPSEAVYVSVADDGPGIDDEFLPRIFEKFEKSSFSSGTGLGLYMARMMVEALEGSIGVSTSPRGTTFQIAIPMSTDSEMVRVR